MSILEQIQHLPEFTPTMLRCQTALYMLQHPEVFYEYVLHDLIEGKESYESYITNIFNGNTWGDTFCATAIGHMFNLAITVITPTQYIPLDVFHNVKDPHIVIVANGGDVNSSKPCTHFSATEKDVLIQVRQGIGLPHEKMIPQKIIISEDTILDIDKWSLDQEKNHTIMMYRAMQKGLTYVNTELEVVTEKVKELNITHDNIVSQMENIGFQIEKVSEQKEHMENPLPPAIRRLNLPLHVTKIIGQELSKKVWKPKLPHHYMQCKSLLHYHLKQFHHHNYYLKPKQFRHHNYFCNILQYIQFHNFQHHYRVHHPYHL